MLTKTDNCPYADVLARLYHVAAQASSETEAEGKPLAVMDEPSGVEVPSKAQTGSSSVAVAAWAAAQAAESYSAPPTPVRDISIRQSETSLSDAETPTPMPSLLSRMGPARKQIVDIPIDRSSSGETDRATRILPGLPPTPVSVVGRLDDRENPFDCKKPSIGQPAHSAHAGDVSGPVTRTHQPDTGHVGSSSGSEKGPPRFSLSPSDERKRISIRRGSITLAQRDDWLDLSHATWLPRYAIPVSCLRAHDGAKSARGYHWAILASKVELLISNLTAAFKSLG